MTLEDDLSGSDIPAATPAATVKILRLRYAGACECGTEVPAGTRAGWDRTARRVVCERCLSGQMRVIEPAETPPPDLETARAEEPAQVADVEQPIDRGRPGASLEQEYQRRRQSREDRIRTRHPRLGRVILALSEEPASTKAFATGADGERRIAARLEKDCGAQVLFLHNRKLGRARRDGDIDHLAVAPSGIYVIDAKRYQNATVRIRRSGGLLSPLKEQLMVAGRDRSKLVDGCAKQRAAVEAALADAPESAGVPVTALLCFVDADLPMWGEQELRGVRLLGPRGTSKLLRRPGALTEAARRALHRHLADALPPA